MMIIVFFLGIELKWNSGKVKQQGANISVEGLALFVQ